MASVRVPSSRNWQSSQYKHSAASPDLITVASKVQNLLLCSVLWAFKCAHQTCYSNSPSSPSSPTVKTSNHPASTSELKSFCRHTIVSLHIEESAPIDLEQSLLKSGEDLDDVPHPTDKGKSAANMQAVPWFVRAILILPAHANKNSCRLNHNVSSAQILLALH